MRIVFASLLGIVISIALFLGMHWMISSDGKSIEKQEKTPHLVYLREKNETKVEKKKRVKPKEPPKKEKVKPIKIIKTNIPKITQKVKVKPLKTVVPKNMDISTISSLSGAQIAVAQQSFIDARSLQAVRKVNPKYPRRAKLKKQEGSVQLQFLINKDGSVSNVVILNSNPKGAFDKASMKAIKKWEFKPSSEAKNATITFNFRLAK